MADQKRDDQIREESFFRTAEIRADDVDDRTVELSVSSEEPVDRWFGSEILSHEKGSVDLRFFGSGNAPLLMDHNHREQIGVVESVRLDKKDRKLRAKLRFSKRSLAQEVLDDVKDGIRSNVSIGYRIKKIESDEKKDEVRVVDWSPFEVSIVSVPADTSVGVGRSQDALPAQPKSKEANMADTPNAVQDDNQSTRTIDTPSGPREVTFTQAQLDQRTTEAMENRNKEVAEIAGLGSLHNMSDKANEFIAQGRSLSEFTGYVRANIPSDKPLHNTDIGLTEKETRNFSVLKLARASMRSATQAVRDEAAFEFEAVQAAEEADMSGVRAKGSRLPTDVMRNWVMPGSTQYEAMSRALNSSDDSDLVPTEHRAGSFIDVLRNMSSVMRAGPTMLQGLSGNVDIPRKTAGSSATWVSTEGGNATESEPTFDSVALTPKDLAVYTDMTRRMRQQSSPDIEQIVRNDIAMAIALGLDLAALEGSGAAGQPTGVLNQTGVNKPTSFAGVNPTFAEVVALETAVADDNALFGNLAYIGRTNMRGAMKTTTLDAGSGRFLIENDQTNGYRYIASNQGTDGNLYFGNWSDVLIGMWGGLDLNFDEAALALSGGLRMIAFQTIDVAVRHGESFAYNNDGV